MTDDPNRPRKTAPPPAALIRAAQGAHRGGAWSGSVSGEALDTDALILFVHTEEVGAGPRRHVHPYDEVFVVTEGRARFTVGERVFDAERLPTDVVVPVLVALWAAGALG